MSVLVLVIVVILSGGARRVYAEPEADLDGCIARADELRATYSVPGTLYMGSACVELELPAQAFSQGG